MTTRFSGLLIGAGLVALQGCASAGLEGEDVAAQGQELGTASLTFTTSTATNYCARVTISNALTQATPRWQVVLDLKGTSVTSVSNATFSAVSSGRVTATPVNLNTSIAPNATAAFDFCGTSTSTTQRPVISAWNMESNAYASCPTNSGVLPTKAAFAVAAAKELGRWDPLTDFVVVTNAKIALSSAASTKCGSGCGNLKALLGQQDSSIGSFISNTQFDPVMLGTELVASMNRQQTKIDDLTRNNPAGLPPAHKLTFVAGPTNLGIGSCGPHYIFQADHLDGTPLTSTEATNLGTSLCFNGYGSCGNNNPYVAFVSSAAGCPTGRTCVAVDPTDGDNSTTSTTTAGSAPTYPMNRTYDPANTLLNTACLTTMGKLGTMTSKCATSPSTCGYLYCIANP